jgi:nucleotide-binding universal stress UspA family protein
MFDKIVVPLDGSKLAEVALPYAEELGAKMGSDIVLLTVLESEEPPEYEKRHRYIKKIEELTKYHTHKYLDNGNCKDIEVISSIRTGNPVQGITEYTLLKAFPLVVMASHGRSGISRWTVGSVADKVVRFSSFQPVMLIRARQSHSDIREKRILKKALVPLDGSIVSEAVIPHIAEIARSLQMELTLLQVAPKTNHTDMVNTEAYLQSVCEELKAEGVNADYKVSTGAVAETIIDMADDLAFDLVAMSTRGMNRNDLFSLGSVAQKVFLGGNTPLLLIKK